MNGGSSIIKFRINYQDIIFASRQISYLCCSKYIFGREKQNIIMFHYLKKEKCSLFGLRSCHMNHHLAFSNNLEGVCTADTVILRIIPGHVLFIFSCRILQKFTLYFQSNAAKFSNHKEKTQV
jgi:hypothetical protein